MICRGGNGVINGTTGLMEMTVDGCVENRQTEEREHLRDNYVLQLQPFNLYPFSHNRNETVALQERALAVSVRQQKHQPYHHHPPKQIEEFIYFCLFHRHSCFKNKFPLVSLHKILVL
ncbi:hypothetical protein OIU85_021093 [Salix viminalis]|uniref:Uncharacterized protein n=1 Tax=Salix viminalis TaxID=40686 RepID=A0A9Q0ZD84_SALVM|nr:hypothetical protein OIU85_021093 [Salix viminalis]